MAVAHESLMLAYCIRGFPLAMAALLVGLVTLEEKMASQLRLDSRAPQA